jgi:eukaryotic-like serine/threonine-protein kinase
LEVRLRSSLADYQLLGSYGPGGEHDGAWLARPPGRLGGSDATVVVTEMVDPGPEAWPAFVERLSDLASIHHDHLPRLVEAGRTEEPEGVVVWVTRDGAATRPLIPAPGQRDPAIAAVAAAARAAHALHEAGWAHGAINPAAVLTGADLTLLAPPLAAVAPDPVRVGPLSSALAYDSMDPMALWGEGPSRASDIWSLAATAHALITGRPLHPPLGGDTVVAAAQRILIEPPELASDLDAPLAGILAACFAPDPADRPQTAAELADQLESLVPGR